MIRIINESKQDWENFEKAMQDSYYRELDAVELDDIVYEFKKYKDYLQPIEKDLYYWIKLAKQGKEAYQMLRAEIDDIKIKIYKKENYKKMCNYFPSNQMRKFKEHENELSERFGEKYINPVFWVKNYEHDKEKTLHTFNSLLRRFGYTEEEMSEVKKGSKLVNTINGFDIYRIYNYLAAEYYGQNTGWCISGNYPGHQGRGEIHFENYMNERGFEYYYFIIKNFKQSGEEDYCLFTEDEVYEEDGYEIWDGTNREDDHISRDELNEDARTAVDWVLKKENVIRSEDTIKQELLALIKTDKEYFLNHYNARMFTRVIGVLCNRNELDERLRDLLIQKREEKEKEDPHGWTREEIEEYVDDSIKEIGFNEWGWDEIVTLIQNYFFSKYGSDSMKSKDEFLKFFDVTDEKLAQAFIQLNAGNSLLRNYRLDHS